MSNYLFNFLIRFIFFWLASAFILQKDAGEALFFATFMAAGFLLMEKLLGSTNIKKQDKKILSILAGNTKTRSDKAAWISIMLVQCIGFLFITAAVLGIFFGNEPWTFAVGALVAIASFFITPLLAKKHSRHVK